MVARVPAGDHSVVVFVRHALPGELVVVEITGTAKRFLRGDAVEVLEPAAERVTAPCPLAHPDGCGGCDFQHVSLPGQRELKAAVVAEQLQRLAGLDLAVTVEEVPGHPDGLHWRTRMRYQVDAEGRAGLRRHRSHEIEAVPAGGCPIAHPGAPTVTEQTWAPDTELLAVAADPPTLLVDGRTEEGSSEITEHAIGRDWRLAADGFWQGHPGAAATLVEAVIDGLRPRAGERAFDLYCGVGLFAGALVDAGVRAWGVEWSRPAIAHARRNVPGAKFTAGKVERVLRTLPKRTDLVVLDPPRTGAGKDVVDAIIARRPRAIAYVACDPAALARDLRRATSGGYRVSGIRAFDLFPMTHHLEAVAILEPS